MLLFQFFIPLAMFPVSLPVLGLLKVEHVYKIVQSDFKKIDVLKYNRCNE